MSKVKVDRRGPKDPVESRNRGAGDGEGASVCQSCIDGVLGGAGGGSGARIDGREAFGALDNDGDGEEGAA